MKGRDPSTMTDAERLAEVAVLLALGFLRDRQIQLAASAALEASCDAKC